MKRSSEYSLGMKLGIGQGVLVLLVMVLFAAALTMITSRRATKEAEQNLDQQAQALVDSMSSYHGALSDSAGKLAAVFRSNFHGAFAVAPSRTVAVGDKQVPVLSSGSAVLNLNTDFVDGFTSLTKAVATVFVRSGDDFIRVSTSLKKEDGSRAIGTALDRTHPAYQGLLKGEEFVGKATLFGKDYMTKYLPVKDAQGKVIAVLFVGLDFTDGLKALKDKIRSVKVGKSGYIYAIDAKEGKDKGKLTIHPAKEGSNILDAQDSDGRKFIAEMVAKKNGIIRYPWINKELGESSPRLKIAAYRHLKEWNWVIGVGSYMEDFNGVATLVRNTVVAAAVLVMILLLALLFVSIRLLVTQPIKKLVQQTERYASGDFTRIDVQPSQGKKPIDEVELLMEGVATMALSLREILSKLMCSAHEIGSAASQVNGAAEGIASGADEIAGKTTTMATAGEEMSATSSEIAHNCQMAAAGAQTATLSAENGKLVVAKTVEVMGQIAHKVQESARTVGSLGERSDQIGEIIGTIEDIADQTNLLALNAAIEAARAGEQGRGFAVVADEVRALAERTTGATREIGDMIKAIQSETKGAVAAMEQGVQQVEAGTAEAARSGEALHEIMQQINDVALQINQIAAAAEEQTSTSCDIANSIHQVISVVQTTAMGARESATAATQLNGNAQELQRLVGQFKLS
jgi:methyl-accepting chemotaxis protein